MTTIPKHIHQIWLGTAPKPEPWLKTVKDFADEHGYDYTLWSSAEAEKELPWDEFPGLRRTYGYLHSQLAGQADIIRLLALYKYGGIYIDADSVVLKPAKFDKFLRGTTAGAFFGWENIPKSHTRKLGDFGPELRGARRLIANGIIGARAGHPFIKQLLGGLVANAEREAGEQAWKKAGPLYVTRVWAKHKKEHPDVRIYPMRYFYPRHWRGITDPLLHTKVKVPGDSMLFQYGYTTNKFAEIFKRRKAAAATRKKGGHK